MVGFGKGKPISKQIQNKISKNKGANFSIETIEKALNLHMEGNIIEAEENYIKCISNGYNDPRIYSNYSIILASKSKSKQAVKLLTECIKLYPLFEPAYLNLSQIYIDSDQMIEAESMTRKAIKLNPKYAKAYNNLGTCLISQGKFDEAELSIKRAIGLNLNFPEAYNNLGLLYINLKKFKEAETRIRKAIEIYPKYAEAHYNLGCILYYLGKLKESELSLSNAIKNNKHHTKAYFVLSTLKHTNNIDNWVGTLFSEDLIANHNNRNEDLINLYFARSNILHKKELYCRSSKYLELANQLKLKEFPSNSIELIEKSKKLKYLNERNIQINNIEKINSFIFIVGMPRSGTTLTETILTMNKSSQGLGEVNFFEESYFLWKNNNDSVKNKRIEDIYYEKVFDEGSSKTINIDKWLYNYQYSSVICNQINNSKIIHCYRNPLDNILSIYRANFSNHRGNSYATSIRDCVEVYLDQAKLMDEYKNEFKTKIYSLNYDLLVTNPEKEIRNLISWLGWKWNDSYLSPHLNSRSISTASSVQVRSKINNKSIGGWKNYKSILKPAIEIFSKIEKYNDFLSFQN